MDYERAKKEYGVSKRLLEQRFYQRKWEKERAITEQVKLKLWENFKGIAEANGIGQKLFYSRIHKLKYCPGKAAIKPKRGRV